jgi:sarcosine oxidase
VRQAGGHETHRGGGWRCHGSSAAWHLAARGADVTLLEQFEPGHTEGSSHGSSRIFRLAYPEPLYVDLALRALPLWRRLEEESGQEILTLTGAVDHGPSQVVAELAAAIGAAGQESELLDPQSAQERWPALRFDSDVLFHRTAGRVNADRAVEAFQHAATAHGAQVRHGVKVTSVVRRGPDRMEVVADDEVLVADSVVIAAGGWASPVLGTVVGAVVDLPPLRVTQEQPVHFPATDALAWPSFIHHQVGALPGRPTIYGLGSADGVKVGVHAVGSPADPDARDRSIDPAALQRVQGYAERWLPGVDASAPSPTTCLYTLTANEDFVVDRVGPITVLAGFSGHGFKFASVIGELAADLVDGRPAIPRFTLAR